MLVISLCVISSKENELEEELDNDDKMYKNQINE